MPAPALATTSSGGAVTLKLRNLSEFLRGLETYWREALPEVEAALDRGIERVFEESQRLVPVDTGYLKSTGFYGVKSTSRTLVAGITYDAEYAIFVHEVPARHAAPTQWKFVEQPFVERFDAICNSILDAVVENW